MLPYILRYHLKLSVRAIHSYSYSYSYPHSFCFYCSLYAGSEVRGNRCDDSPDERAGGGSRHDLWGQGECMCVCVSVCVCVCERERLCVCVYHHSLVLTGSLLMYPPHIYPLQQSAWSSSWLNNHIVE